VCLPGLCPVPSLASPPPASRALRNLIALAPAACRAVERARLTSCSTVDSLLSAKAHAQRPASPPPASRALRNMIALARVACLAIAARAFDRRRRQSIMRPPRLMPRALLAAACFSRPAELGRYSACSLPRPRARASDQFFHAQLTQYRLSRLMPQRPASPPPASCAVRILPLSTVALPACKGAVLFSCIRRERARRGDLDEVGRASRHLNTV